MSLKQIDILVIDCLLYYKIANNLTNFNFHNIDYLLFLNIIHFIG